MMTNRILYFNTSSPFHYFDLFFIQLSNIINTLFLALLNRWQLSPTLIPTGHDLRPETHAILFISLE